MVQCYDRGMLEKISTPKGLSLVQVNIEFQNVDSQILLSSQLDDPVSSGVKGMTKKDGQEEKGEELKVCCSVLFTSRR